MSVAECPTCLGQSLRNFKTPLQAFDTMADVSLITPHLHISSATASDASAGGGVGWGGVEWVGAELEPGT